jgi:hypothetical protein
MSLQEFMNPVQSGLISMLIRNAPFDSLSSAYEEFRATIQKELDAALTVLHPAMLDYTAIFSHDKRYSYRMYHNLPIARDTCYSIFRAMSSSKSILSRQLFLPQFSIKSIGKRAVEAVRSTGLAERYGLEGNSTRDLEVIYHKTGFRCSGETEMRWAWKFLDLKPRVYYARGPDQYYDSRYIQPIFNIIIDLLNIVNRFSRYHSETIQVIEGLLVFIYDYSSFTSSLHEIRRFTATLAEFFRGTTVRYLDTYHGIIERDLGDILDEFNRSCNLDPSFDVSDLLDIDEGGILTHNCGMLGVPGNITSCTLLHGIHLAVILESLNQGKVVGDDAIAAFLPNQNGYEKITMMEALTNLGNVAPEKVESWESGRVEEHDGDDAWHYTKRPINRLDNESMFYGTQIVWPSLANILNLSDALHTTSAEDISSRQKVYANQVYRFLRSMEHMPRALEDRDVDLVQVFLKGGHEALNIPRNGIKPQVQGSQCWVPGYRWEGDMVGMGIESISACVVDIPMEFDASVHSEIAFYKNCSFRYKSTGVLSLLEKLGYLEKKIVMETVIADEHWDRIDRLLRKENYGRYVYEYVVLDEPPEWTYAVLQHSRVPHDSRCPSMHVDEDLIGYIHEFLGID